MAESWRLSSFVAQYITLFLCVTLLFVVTCVAATNKYVVAGCKNGWSVNLFYDVHLSPQRYLNLYINSIMQWDVKTGKRLWQYRGGRAPVVGRRCL
jgi:hypothetical protein